MTESFNGESALVELLEQANRENLATWTRQRSSETLASFVTGKLALLDEEIDLV